MLFEVIFAPFCDQLQSLTILDIMAYDMRVLVGPNASHPHWCPLGDCDLCRRYRARGLIKPSNFTNMLPAMQELKRPTRRDRLEKQWAKHKKRLYRMRAIRRKAYEQRVAEEKQANRYVDETEASLSNMALDSTVCGQASGDVDMVE